MLRATIRILHGDRGEDRALHSTIAGAELLLLADGAGGIMGGAIAADLAVCSADRLYAASLDPLLVLRQLDRLLLDDSDAGEATFVMAVVRNGVVTGASVGDSGAWLFTGVSAPVDLTFAQRRKPLLGSGEAVPVAFGPHPFGGRLLLGSDGLFKYARPVAIAAGARGEDLEAAADQLVRLPALPNGCLHDDVCVVLAEPA